MAVYSRNVNFIGLIATVVVGGTRCVICANKIQELVMHGRFTYQQEHRPYKPPRSSGFHAPFPGEVPRQLALLG